ncbi:hypothetical protein NECAME_08272 [Necator americanus]|uniref:von Hippel-Lindau disease tumour suppressor beta domain-containing protein n=1 Tax=Necator americanus TaxID=51031 RepID=W2TIP2_NECAM|nr:hypothetical protein NECAME_08272 [Necator americanus]ETN81970.1 hypothetical protein NECAME_08272 [Necator americanus]
MDGAVQAAVGHNINASGLGIRNIRSGVGTVAVYVRFFNLTGTDVDVIWINEEGRGIRYGQLKKSQYLDINTYEGHPWIFRESGVGDLLIGQPVMSLRDWAVRTVANLVEIAPDALLTLPLPASQIRLFQRVIQNLLVHRLQYVSMFEPNPLIGRRLRATVRRYMNPSAALPAPEPFFGNFDEDTERYDGEQNDQDQEIR